MQIGFILTSAMGLDSLRRHAVAGAIDVLKLKTAWGLPWDDAGRHGALRIAPITVLGTAAGDLSYGRSATHPWGVQPYPVADAVVAEIRPWYAQRDPARELWIEIGNEPLLDPLPGHERASEAFAWLYRWHLQQAIAACRREFPAAKIVAPAHIQNHPIPCGPHADGQAWMTAICADVYRQCDALGLHAYSVSQLGAGVEQLRSLVSTDMPIWLTEFALNEPMSEALRGAMYAQTLRAAPLAGVTLYHLDELGGTDPAHFSPHYRLTPTTLEAFAAAWRAVPAPTPVRPSPKPARPAIANVAMSREHLTRGRARPIAALVIHATAGRAPGDLTWLRQGGSLTSPVSVHYYIARTGAITQLVADHDTAWHAGASAWRDLAYQGSLNAASIGIELENRNTGTDPYPVPQYAACVALARHLVATYGIPRHNLVRHLDISPGRKTDPAGFPWERFAADVYQDLP